MSATLGLRHAPGGGSKSHYSRGCRCDECREASRIKHKAQRDRNRVANSLVYQRELEAARAWKERHHGTCEECGGKTRYNGHTTKGASRLCAACAAKVVGANRVGTGATQQALRDLLLANGEMRFMEIVAAFNGLTGPWAGRLARYRQLGLVERVGRGRYRWVA